MVGAEEKVTLPNLHFLAERKIQGCDMGSNQIRVDIPRYVEFYKDGFTTMIQGDTVRSIITFDY